LACKVAFAQQQFPFVIPWNDATHTDVDVSSLNAAPAGANGFIVVKDGHFVESKTGKRVRFLGVNFAGAAAFPDHDDAAQVASRLAKYGVNLVRLHHMDNPWGIGNGASIWDASYKDRQHIDPQQLDKLDYLIYQLKQHGIYVNINLHVSRQFTPADGFPESVNHLPEDYDKRVDEFDSRMIQLQKNYARDLLTHVNPYTHLAYISDPCVLNVEINNENSLVGDPWANLGAQLNYLPEPFNGELQGLWNKWLAAKYSTSKSLQAAWLAGTSAPGPSILKPTAVPANWFLEKNNPGVAGDLSTDGDALLANVTAVDGTAWHMQLDQMGLDIKNGGTYTVTFRAKADAPRDLNFYAGLDENDWHHIGLDSQVHLTPDWQTFTFTFDASDTAPSHNRLTFVLGNQTGKMWLSDVTLSPGAAGLKLAAGESLATRNIAIPSNPISAQKTDWLAFLADTERSYAIEMRDYLKNDLHLHALVICSQVSWGGLSGVYRENAMDFADNHAYWQHPQFPGKPWDPVDWRIENTSMVPTLGKGDTLTGLAQYRIAGKPYSVSEYNHPAPNDYQSECVPLYASFAAFQDWDTIYLFDYGDYGKNADNSKIQSYFGVGPNPAKWAFMPAAAMIFRESEIPAAPMVGPGVPTKFSGSYFAKNLTAGSVWQKLPPDPTAPFNVALGLSFDQMRVAQLMSDHDILSANADNPKTARYTADDGAAKAVVGFVADQSIDLTDVSFQFGDMPDNFASLTLTAMDGKSLASSRRALLTVADRVDNTGMVWNAAHDSVNDHWGTDPTIADGVPVTVTLTTDGPRKVFALDGTGEQTKLVPSTYAGGKLTFSAGPEYKTLWYAIVK
jgi:hypothetical protein